MSAEVIVFAGPTVSAADGSAILDAAYLPPAAQGDLYRAALTRPRAIGLIDGYFARVPAVWHKEILWAMDQGIHVFGAASMGALRAAELTQFGMDGVGEIFEAFQTGRYEADDEVAVAHGPADSGYRSVSEALVNIRATLDQAHRHDVISGPMSSALLEIARNLYYPLRSYPQLLATARDRDLDRHQLEALRTWLPNGRVDQKRTDAIAMLQVMRRRLDQGLEPKTVTYVFEHTQVWDRACSAASLTTAADDGSLELVADELRLRGEDYRRAYVEALTRHLMLEHGARHRLQPATETLTQSQDRLRKVCPSADADTVARLAREQATLRLVEAQLYPDILRRLPDQLRVSGTCDPLMAAARSKAALLTERAGVLPSLTELGLDEDSLTARFFARRGDTVPDDLDQWARRTGFASTEAFRRAALLDHIHSGGDR